MKKTFLLCDLCALMLLGCKSKNDPENVQQHQDTFRVQQLAVETEPMNAPSVRKVAPLTDEDGSQITDLILFDCATYLSKSSPPHLGNERSVHAGAPAVHP